MEIMNTTPAKIKKIKKRPCGDSCPLEPNLSKTAAKVGMVASLGVTFTSGILKFKGAKPLHIWASVAFVGFTIMHCAAYKTPKRITK
ncbi:hypothetical protein [Maridesulfovibrio ferrireducens]|uniref:Uncharacterized protein n=1 Tax=Maridesulfovibrio ferrireducens TaxID=246191 RepID=A0A1G9GZJ4_9BACT|nr:hypothetical protein [Maridesulfovibrio ferrireducens]MBI9112763.1 hypothetical protein [Maridesulfovibrio ferrireducens]SDL05703.1 hypothetical protein SAMN05660337_1929 [Maridesulfovibrio ferrireducens]